MSRVRGKSVLGLSRKPFTRNGDKKMKKRKPFILSCLGICACALTVVACSTGETDNFTYEQTDGGYAVCGVSDYQNGKIEIPATYNGANVVAIADGAFQDEESLVTVVIPDSVQRIGDNAFNSCGKLETVTFGGGVSAFGESAFQDCTEIKEIVLPESLEEIGASAFKGCKSLKELKVPDNVKTVGDTAFVGCEKLESVEIGDSLEWLGLQAFAENEGILTVSVSDSAPLAIGTQAFMGCKQLVTVDFGGTVEVGSSAFQGCAKLSEVVLGDECVSIGEKAFASCFHLTGVTVGKSLVSIGNNAFSSCYTLVEVYNRSTLGFIAGDNGNGKIAQDALYVYKQEGQSRRFKDENGVVYYQDGERVIALGQVGFETGLAIVLHERTTEVYPMAFYNNLNIASVTFLENVQKIGKQAFNFCYKLRKIVVGDGVVEIGERAFDRCEILGNVILGASVQTVGENAFNRDSYLLSDGNIYYKGTAEDFSRIAFADGNSNLTGALKYYYAETKPAESGNYWYYGELGQIKIWDFKENT